MRSYEEQFRISNEEAISRAIEEGKKTTFLHRQVVAHRSMDHALAFLRTEGEEAVLEAAGKRVGADESLIKRVPRSEIYDPNRYVEILGELALRDAKAASGRLFSGKYRVDEPS